MVDICQGVQVLNTVDSVRHIASVIVPGLCLYARLTKNVICIIVDRL
jgi:hypothetical protein